MKFKLYVWRNNAKAIERLERIGYTHLQVEDGDVFDAARRCYEAGFNIRLIRTTAPECEVVLAVDDGNFTQR